MLSNRKPHFFWDPGLLAVAGAVESPGLLPPVVRVRSVYIGEQKLTKIFLDLLAEVLDEP